MTPRTAAVAATLLLLSGCGVDDPAPVPSGPGSGTAGTSTSAPAWRGALRITTLLGDQCPHTPATPDPSCDPKPVAGTDFEVTTASGGLVMRGRTGAQGQAIVNVEPGTYVVQGGSVPGWRITSRQQVTVSGTETVPVPLTYTAQSKMD